jgi:hypothetical protein
VAVTQGIGRGEMLPGGWTRERSVAGGAKRRRALRRRGAVPAHKMLPITPHRMATIGPHTGASIGRAVGEGPSVACCDEGCWADAIADRCGSDDASAVGTRRALDNEAGKFCRQKVSCQVHCMQQ